MNIIEWGEGDREVYTPDEYLNTEHNRSRSTVSLIASTQRLIAEDQLVEKSRHNEHVIERALEEDAFYGEMAIPGWFVNNDDELTDEFGSQHNGGTVRVRGLMEDYSENAFRVICKQADGQHTDLVFHYCWFFVPKSVVDVTTTEKPESEGEMGDFESELHEAEKRQKAKLNFDEDKTWKEMLVDMPDVDLSLDELEEMCEEDEDLEEVDLDRRAPAFEVGDMVQVTEGMRAGETGEVSAVVPAHSWDNRDWTYHISFSPDPCDWLPVADTSIENPLHVPVVEEPWKDEDGEVVLDLMTQLIHFQFYTEVEGFWVGSSGERFVPLGGDHSDDAIKLSEFDRHDSENGSTA